MSPPMEKKGPGPFEDLIEFGELKKKIPKHLLERSLFWGVFFTCTSLFCSAVAQYCWWQLVHTWIWTNTHWVLLLPLDLLAIWIVGTVHTGMWSFAHECGHGGTTPYTWLNDTIGFILHTALIVPYFPWQQSHAQHHARNQHVTQGETHRPERTQPWKERPKTGMKSTTSKRYWFKRNILHPAGIVLGLVIGWRMYLVFGMTGAINRPDGRKIKFHTHHLPSDMFPNNYPAWKIWLSNIALVVPLYGWYLFHQHFGGLMFFRMILGPQFVVDLWLNAITKAQHSHPQARWMNEETWTWFRGAIQTVDYSYGPIVDWLHHYIGPSHVSHHIFPSAPAHNGPEITKILKRELGRHYIRSKRGPWETMFANSYLKVTELPDEHGIHDWVGVHNPELF